MKNSTQTVKNIKKEKIIYKNLSKYNQTQEKIFQNKIKNLMFHKKSHFTAIFTEYLIWDDNQEFLYDLYPLIYSIKNYPSYIKIQYNKFFIPIIINEWGRNLIKINFKMKKLLISQITEKSKQIDQSKYILKKYSKILPSDLSDNTIEDKEGLIDSNAFKIFKNSNIKNNNNQNLNNNNKNPLNNNIPFKGKEISESESTIDNVNANNDISISLDLKMNQKYDDKILDQNVGFVKGKNGKNDEDLLRMMNYLKPINTANIYPINKNKIRKNYIYLDYVNSKAYRLTETKKSSKNKVDNKKKLINYNITNNNNNDNLKTFINLNIPNNSKAYKNINSKNTSLNKNKKQNEYKDSMNKTNIKLYSKSNNKGNNSKNNKKTNNQNNIHINNNIINGYNDLNNKTTSTKTNSYNTTYKNKSENKNPAIVNNRNKKNENGLNTQNISDNRVMAPFTNESKAQENKDKEINNLKYNSLKFGKKNKKIILEENSKIQTIFIPPKKIFNIKEKNYEILKTKNINNVNNINICGGEIKNFKKNFNKILNISSDSKKIKFVISPRDDNNYINNINKITGRQIKKKEKSLDNKPSNNGIYKTDISQINNKNNIIIIKRKISDGINKYF